LISHLHLSFVGSEKQVIFVNQIHDDAFAANKAQAPAILFATRIARRLCMRYTQGVLTNF
jgi:hypothetical protein